MEKSESIAALTAAVAKTILEIDGINKNKLVGEGKSAYKAVADADVKRVVGKAMARNGLVLLPTELNTTISVEKTVEETQWGQKNKRSVFVEANTKYILSHESGEWITVVGYGHGMDSQDKAAGKATTYAMKYALLYVFQVETTLDDADDAPTPAPAPQPKTAPAPQSKPARLVSEIMADVPKATTVQELTKLYKELPAVAQQELKDLFTTRRGELDDNSGQS